jgi:hypothetical protein
LSKRCMPDYVSEFINFLKLEFQRVKKIVDKKITACLRNICFLSDTL